jgi:hypothetical protein
MQPERTGIRTPQGIESILTILRGEMAMKIDVDLAEIFDEGENVDDSIKERIIQTITNRIYSKIERDVSGAINEIVKSGTRERVDQFLEELIPNLMDYEYQETERYGVTQGTKTTVKREILRILQEQCVYKEARSGYSSDNNTFTKAMQNIIEKQMSTFKPMFDKELNAVFVKEAMAYAQTSLQKKLGIK